MMFCISLSKWLITLVLLLPVSSFHVSQHSSTKNTAFADSPSTTLPRRPTAMNSLATGAVEALDGFFRTCPYTAAALTCGFKASAADMVAQKSAGDAKGTDLKRNVAFGIYGALYQGAMQEYVYNHLYPAMFGAGTSVSIVLTKVFFDLLVQTTLVTLPVAYLTKAAVYQYKPSKAMKMYWHDIMNEGLLKKYFMLWGPVQCLTFSIIPEHFRVSFIACVSFFWLIILSKLSSKQQTPTVVEDPLKKVVAAESRLKKLLLEKKRIKEAVAVAGE